MTLPTDESSGASPYFVPRTGLKRTLKYRTHFRVAYYFLLFSAALLFLGGVYAFFTGDDGNAFGPLELFLLVAALPAVGVVLARRQVGAVAFVSIQVRPDGFAYVEPRRTTEYFYSDVASVRVWYIPYLGGRAEMVFTDGRKVSFTSALERSEYVLESLLAARPELLPGEAAQRFRRTAVAADHSWARLDERTVRRPWHFFTLFFGLPLVGGLSCLPFLPAPEALALGIAAWDKTSFFVAVFGLNLVLGLGTWTIGELYLLMRTTRRLQLNPSLVMRDTALERKVFLVAGILQGALLALSLITIVLGIVRG